MSYTELKNKNRSIILYSSVVALRSLNISNCVNRINEVHVLPYMFFRCLHDHYEEAFDNKLKCIVHYFGRICSSMPAGYVSFERKVLSLQFSPSCIPYPKEKLWSQSNISLCHYEVRSETVISIQLSCLFFLTCHDIILFIFRFLFQD